MPKSRNMGRKSHHVLDGEFNQNQPGNTDDLATRDQPTRPTVHPAQANDASKEQPQTNHSRRGD
jgi:hypothetical protein